MCRVNFARKIFLTYEFSYEKCSEIFSEFLSLYFVGQRKSRKIPAKSPTKFPCEKIKKIHRRASAGAQGENNIGRKCHRGTQTDSPLVAF